MIRAQPRSSMARRNGRGCLFGRGFAERILVFKDSNNHAAISSVGQGAGALWTVHGKNFISQLVVTDDLLSPSRKQR